MDIAMKMTRWMWTLGIPTLIAGCAAGSGDPTEKSADQPLFSTQSIQGHLAGEGIIDFGTTVFAQNPTTLLEPGTSTGMSSLAKQVAS